MDYNKKAREYTQIVRDYLCSKDKLESIDIYTLESLEKAYRTLLLSEDDVDNRGILVTNRFDDIVANPAVKMANDTRIQINKLLENMGITHKLRYKNNAKEEEETDLDNFLSNESV